MSLEKRFIGALLGTAVGDALGMPVEGWSAEKIDAKFGEITNMKRGRAPKGTYTDDTQMMIAVAESLIENKGFDGGAMAKKFLEHFTPERGYGRGTRKALANLRNGKTWKKAGEGIYGEGSFGNGAVMRIAPVGVRYYATVERLREVAEQSAMITHAHPVGMDGAAVQAYAIALALVYGLQKNPRNGWRAEMIEALIKFAKTEKMKDVLENTRELFRKEAERELVIQELGHASLVFRSVPTAIFSFLVSENFEDAVIYAVNLGGDTDTIGAMTGAIAGAHWKEEAIPEPWKEELETGKYGREYLISLAQKLYSQTERCHYS